MKTIVAVKICICEKQYERVKIKGEWRSLWEQNKQAAVMSNQNACFLQHSLNELLAQ